MTHSLMVSSRNSTSHPLFFILVGIPGMENYQFWVAFPFCVMYAVAVAGNVSILHIIRIDHTLHEPMYLFLAMLATTDLVLSSSTQPKMLAILWFHDHEIEYHACLIQVFFIHAFSSVESGVLMAMALDRYVAICSPLRHSSILTTSVVIRLGAAVMVRGLLWVSPFCFMISRMPFCPNNVIPQSYCEHMAVLKLVCADTRVNRGYGLFGAFSVVGFDIIVISVSYVMILRTVLRLPSGEARLKAFGTCASHVCVILAFYIPALFTFLTHRFGHHVPQVVHIMFANVYLLVPSMLNPITYGVRTRQMRDRVIHRFCGKCPFTRDHNISCLQLPTLT
ncbi:olfactory receptor 52R1-like [Psammomys obesus]|uniref:olfactory receptor 52R1-like n=1 Tax=Psammomys obesus TaxID=48139 RepID=UPI0024531ED9|nr:olfactory receptor 52R1-like [Psammomys obesus]